MARSAERRAGTTASGSTGGRPCVTILVALLSLSCPAAAAAQFSVQPVIVEMVAGDTTATTVLQAHNDGTEPIQLRFYTADFHQSVDGRHAFLEAGTAPHSCAGRLQIYPDAATLDAEATQEIRVLMEPVDSTCWSMVFVESVAPAETGLNVAQRIGVKVYGTPGRTPLEGEIRDVRVETDSVRTAVIEFANPGRRPIRPQGEIEVRTLEGDVAAVVPVPAFSVLPASVRQTRIAVGASLEPGTYVLVPILDFGGDYLAGGQALLEIEEP